MGIARQLKSAANDCAETDKCMVALGRSQVYRAANEIERLTAENEMLRAERAELWELLEDVNVSLKAVGGHCDQPLMAQDARTMSAKVKAALSARQPKEAERGR